MESTKIQISLDKINANTGKTPNEKFQFHSKTFGPLFSGTQLDENGNNVAWVAQNKDYTCDSKEQFYIIKTGAFTFGNEEFKIKSVRHNSFLQMDERTDGQDYYVTLSPIETGQRNQSWYLVNVDNTTEFKIMNMKFNGPMFCGSGTDDWGDHWAWIEPNFLYENNGKERWFISMIGNTEKEVATTELGDHLGSITLTSKTVAQTQNVKKINLLNLF